MFVACLMPDGNEAPAAPIEKEADRGSPHEMDPIWRLRTFFGTSLPCRSCARSLC